jgi:hypothetical protein
VKAVLIGALAALSVAGSSAAQGINFGALQTPDIAGNAMRAWEAGAAEARAEQARQAQLQAYQQQAIAAQEDQSMRQYVGALVSQGRCAEARSAALGRGWLGMAGQVDQLCQAAPPSETPAASAAVASGPGQ